MFQVGDRVCLTGGTMYSIIPIGAIGTFDRYHANERLCYVRYDCQPKGTSASYDCSYPENLKLIDDAKSFIPEDWS